MKTGTHSPAKPELRDSTVLIIAEDPDLSTTITDCLEDAEIRVEVAGPHENGVQKALESRPDLIVLDALASGTDPYATCSGLKAAADTNHIPVICLTAGAGADDTAKAFAAGAADCVSKPFHREELVARVGVHLHNRILIDRLHQAETDLQQQVEQRTVEMARAIRHLREEITACREAEEALRESEERLRALYDDNPSMYFMIDPQGLMLSVNPFGAEQLGYDVEELLGQSMLDVFHPDDRESVRERLTACMDHCGEVLRWELRKIRKDGSVMWVREAARAVYEGKGDLAVLVVCEDISKRKQIEEAFSSLLINAPIGIFIVQQGKFMVLNPGLEKVTGFSWEDSVGRDHLEFVLPEFKEMVRTNVIDMLKGKRKTPFEYQAVSKTGETRWLMQNVTSTRYNGERATLGFFIDITERKKVEEALRESEAKYRTIFENSGTALIFIEDDTTISLCNKEFEKLSGWFREEVEGKKSWQDFVAEPADLERMKAYHRLRRVNPDAAPQTYEFRFIGRQGELKDIVVTVATMPGRKQSQAALLDITERKRAEQALVEARNYLDKIINTVADPIFVKDREHRWVMINDAYCSLVGYDRDALIGKSDHDFFPKQEADIFWAKDEAVFTTGHENINEESFTDAKGVVHTSVTKKTLYTDDRGEKYIVGIIRDITVRKNLEEQLRQAAKMEAIGTLAGGIAHDFNNLTTAVLGYSQLLLHKIPQGDPLRRDVEQIRKAGERSASLTSQLLAFSRKRVVQPKVVDLSDVIADTEKMLRRLIGEDISLVSNLDPALGRVMVDPDLIGQVVMNLAINARDAMPRGGSLTIETANVHLYEADAEHFFGVEPGPYVLLAVADSGTGMDEKTLSHIFEPFFTTKDKGKGTGLGLATVYGIVNQSGGHIRVQSELGRGSTFQIFLPRAEEDTGWAGPGPAPAELPRGGSETILLVEDDNTVRTLAGKILRMNGYAVLEARDGDEALYLSTGHKGSIQLLVTDIVMPGMSGRELAARIESQRPKMKVLFISGYAPELTMHHDTLGEGTVFLQKPFTPEELARKVREALDQDTEVQP